MHFTSTDIQNMDRIKRIHLINSISGIKPANLIGTISDSGQTNLAIFSSVVHLGSDPALFGFIMRPTEEVPRHTYENIMQNGTYTINHVHTSFVEQAHYTSAKFDVTESEFEACGFTEEFVNGFKAPFVQQSRLKLGLTHVESIPIPINGTLLVIGRADHIYVDDDALSEDGQIDLSAIENAGISGLNRYYALQKINEFPYARRQQVPDFSSK